ncbi:hypothetical protein [Candidatus Collinsella stercoripullorum]|uniref:hypothetical protein n=1 Tax=Candidatus Collinsella stercoripullorum TaxID=2838522 RepID=UPI0022E88970|nr:hypothetical protein [Candidatus Collinsella stercoripullorum]
MAKSKESAHAEALRGSSGEQRIALFESGDGEASLSVGFEDDIAWLTQAQMADLFGRTQPVSRVISIVSFQKKELVRDSNIHR